MAIRLNRNHSELVLKRIKTSQLVNRLQDHTFGTLTGPPTEEYPKGRPIQMTDSQVRSACFLIERTLAKAVLPQDLNINGNLTCIFRDPTDRPAEMNGYHRKPALHDGD
jgi:hypothetical protein